MTDLSYCASGCTTRDGNKLTPTLTEPPSTLCDHCLNVLWDKLKTIGTHYPTLRQNLLPGSVEKDPDVKQAKRTEAPAPMRLVIVDLTDNRPIPDTLDANGVPKVRGVTGLLQQWSNMVRHQRSMTPQKHPTVDTELQVLRDHYWWIVDQIWAVTLLNEIRDIARTVLDAAGVYRARPLAWCDEQITTEEHPEPHSCGGPLFKIGEGPTCVKCHVTWTSDSLAARYNLLPPVGA